MHSLKDMSRARIAIISVLVWFAPSCFLLFQLIGDRADAIKGILYLPLMYGFTASMWLRVLLQQRWFAWIFAALISIGFPLALVVLMFRSAHWRAWILIAGLIISCLFTAAAYCLLRA